MLRRNRPAPMAPQVGRWRKSQAAGSHKKSFFAAFFLVLIDNFGCIAFASQTPAQGSPLVGGTSWGGNLRLYWAILAKLRHDCRILCLCQAKSDQNGCHDPRNTILIRRHLYTDRNRGRRLEVVRSTAHGDVCNVWHHHGWGSTLLVVRQISSFVLYENGLLPGSGHSMFH